MTGEGKDAARAAGLCPHGNLPSTCLQCAKEKREHELRNLEYIDNVLVEGAPHEREELFSFLKKNGMDERQIELSVQARQLRRKVHEEMREELKRRLAERPEPDDEERALGTYREMIEPQVRDAVRVLWKKGYRLRGSGFWDFNLQNVYCGGPCFKGLDEGTRAKLAAFGAKVSHRDGIVSFEADVIDLQAMKEKWDAIAAALPDTGHPAEPWPSNNFEPLRKRYGVDEKGRGVTAPEE